MSHAESNTTTVAFTAMEHGTREDYDLVAKHDAENAAELSGRVISWMKMMDGPSPYRISRLEHCLQSATRAEDDGADDEMIACALLHDVGDVIAPTNHSQAAAALLRPYISDENWWIINHHGLFQGYYYFKLYDIDQNLRDQYKDHEYYEACVEFCHRWDQSAFDPLYPTRPLDHFEPLVHDLLRETRFVTY